jgi:opacity protein-like surface antigen
MQASSRALLATLAIAAGLAAAAPPVSAEPPEILLAAGALRPADLGTAAWLDAGVGLSLAGLRLEADVGYWSRSERAFLIQARRSDLQIGASLVLRRRLAGRLGVLASGGGALHLVKDSAGPVAGPSASEQHTRWGLQASAGPELTLSGRVRALAAVRFERVFGDGGSETYRSLFAAFRISLG